jgi:broad specificity phosphatase PhoE
MSRADLFVVRHGRTTLNAEGRFRGRLDPPLDEQGRQEAEAVGRRLLISPPVRVFTSPLRRARETADRIALVCDAPRSTDDHLIDLDYGAWSGLIPEEAGRRDPEAFAVYLNDPERAILPGGEPHSAVADRILKGLQRLAETFPGQTVAAVSHEVPIRLLVNRVAGLTGPDPWDLLLPTGAAVHVAISEGKFELPRPRPVLVSRRWRDVPIPVPRES